MMKVKDHGRGQGAFYFLRDSKEKPKPTPTPPSKAGADWRTIPAALWHLSPLTSSTKS